MIHFLQFRKKTIGTNNGKFSQGTVWMEKEEKRRRFFFWKKSERTGLLLYGESGAGEGVVVRRAGGRLCESV